MRRYDFDPFCRTEIYMRDRDRAAHLRRLEQLARRSQPDGAREEAIGRAILVRRWHLLSWLRQVPKGAE